MNLNKCRLIAEKYSQSEFVDRFIVPFFQKQEAILAGEIMTACYYYGARADSSPYDAMLCLANGITPIDEDTLQVTNNDKNLVLSVELLFGILNTPEALRPIDLKPQNFLKLIRLYPLLMKLEKSTTKMVPQIAEQVKEWVMKKPKVLFKEKKF